MTTLHNGIPLSRRKLFRVASLWAFALPVLRQIEASAAPAAAPKRLICIFSPNGPMVATGPASGTETGFTLHDWWQPLNRHRDVGLFLSHMAVPGQGTVPGSAHGLGGAAFSGAGANGYDIAGPSIDHLIAQRLTQAGRAGLAPSVVWGTSTSATVGGTGEPFARGPKQYIAAELNPANAFRQLFSTFQPPAGGGVDPHEKLVYDRDRSVLSLTRRDCDLLRDSLGVEGAALLEEHCTTLRTLEQRLSTPMARPSTCTKPADPGQNSAHWTNPENHPAQVGRFWDLSAAALACELTHVISFQFGPQAARNRLPAAYGVAAAPTQDSGDSGAAHHPWTHNANNATKTAALRTFQRHYSEQVAQLVDRLKTTNDSSGQPLINSTMVLWLSELGGHSTNGDAHITSSSPIILFGGPSVLRGNRYIHGPSPEGTTGSGVVEAGRQAARILVSAFRHMGFNDVNTVGSSNVNGPFSLT